MKVLEEFSEQKESYYQYLERYNIRAKELAVEAEYRQIQKNHDQAISAVEQLNNEYQHLDGQYQQLDGQCKQLNDENERLQSELTNRKHEQQQSQRALAQKLIAVNNLSDQQIADICELTIEQVQQLKPAP